MRFVALSQFPSRVLQKKPGPEPGLQARKSLSRLLNPRLQVYFGFFGEARAHPREGAPFWLSSSGPLVMLVGAWWLLVGWTVLRRYRNSDVALRLALTAGAGSQPTRYAEAQHLRHRDRVPKHPP